MTQSINKIIVAGLMTTPEFAERLSVLMEQSCQFSDTIMRCADPVVKSVKLDPNFFNFCKNEFPFEVKDARVSVNEYGTIQIQIYVPKFVYYTDADHRYDTLTEHPDMPAQPQECEGFTYKKTVEGWTYLSSGKYEEYVIKETI